MAGARRRRSWVASGSTRRRTGAVELREAAKAATRSCGTPAANDAAHRHGAPSAGSAHACHPADPVSSSSAGRARGSASWMRTGYGWPACIRSITSAT
jgi:hypothetical protein